MKHSNGVAVMIERGDTVLLIKRSKNAYHTPGKWENPGGKCDTGESFDDAIDREVMEEVGVELTSKNFFRKKVWHEKERDIEFTMHIYRGTIAENAQPKIMEPEVFDDITWAKKSELPNMELAPYLLFEFKEMGWL